MKLFKQNNNLAALDGGRRFSLDKALTITTFVLLIIIVIIPIFMIIFNTFFVYSTTGRWNLDLSMFKTQLTDTKNLSAMWNTVKIAFFTTIVGTIAGSQENNAEFRYSTSYLTRGERHQAPILSSKAMFVMKES